MTEATKAPEVTLDDFGKQAIEQANAIIAQRNEKVGVIQAAQGDAQGLLEALRTTSDNPEVVKINKEIDKLNDALLERETKRDEILKPVVEEMRKNAQSQQESLTAEVDALDAKIKATRGYVKSMYGEGALTLLTDLLGRKNRDHTGGGGGSRIRGFDVYVDDNLATQRDAQGQERSNFSAAAKAAKVDTITLQEAFWTAQGTRDSKQFKDRVEFSVTEPGEGGATHKVVAVKVKDDSSDEAASE